MAVSAYDAVRDRFAALLAERAGAGIERRPVSAQEREAAGRALSATAVTQRRRREDENASLFSVAEDARRSPGAPAGWTQADLENHYLARLLEVGAGGAPVSIGSLGHWLPILPPFDFQRTEGNGVLDDTLNTGVCLTIPTDNGLSLAGVGFQVSPSEEKQASIAPRGTYEFNMFCLGGSPAVRSQGGLSAAVYVDGNPDPVAERHALLWNLVGVPQFFGQQGSGNLRDAATPASPGSFGSVPLSPLDVPFHPGHSYVVWYWCWQQSNAVSGDGFFATLKMTFEGARIYQYPPFVGPA